MKTINLTQGKVALVDDEDYESLSKYKWYACKHGCYYALRHDQESSTRNPKAMHHEIMVKNPRGMTIDHIDGNGLNNQRMNLRICTTAQNQWNSSKRTNNKSGFKGVYFHHRDKRWVAQIMVNNIRKYLGNFDTPELAAIAFNEAAIKYHGKFARLNNIPEAIQKAAEGK